MFRTNVTNLVPKLLKMAIFGHSGQSEVLHNDAIEFPMGQKLGIDIQIKSLECSECMLQIWPFWLILVQKWPQMAISDTQANPRCLKMVLLD